MSRSATALFILMCAIWGSTWIAMRFGVAQLPPLFFAGTRFIVAGLLMMAWHLQRGGSLQVSGGELRALAPAIVLAIVGCYGLLFWGMQHAPSGLAAVVNLSLIPVCLYIFGLLAGQERYLLSRLLALAVGLTGLGLLFAPALAQGTGDSGALGLGAVAASAVVYCWGSVLARPMIQRRGPIWFGAWATTIGGIVLVGLSCLFERWPADLVQRALRPEVAASWLFLVLFGSLAAFTIYLRLLRDWGPLRAGLYAFVSPLIAVILGALVFDERLTARDGFAAMLMLGAAWIALYEPRTATSRTAP
ncbi:MAG: EamA family transporter [Burkholderiales bacterium]|nr:EamA family transporter [Burkholderiales bacterium]